MRKLCLFLFLWISPFLLFFALVTACSESEKKVASGYTEEQNAWDIQDTVAYLKLLKTWEPAQPVDSAQRTLDMAGAPEDAFWYDIVFLSESKTFFSYTGSDSTSCAVNIYNDENGVRLTVHLDSAREFFTQILQRDSMVAIVIDRLDKTYENRNAVVACEEDSLAFVESCGKSKGTVVDQLGLSCTELHLICTKEIMPKKTAEEFLDSTAGELKNRCAEDLGLSPKQLGNGNPNFSGKYPWRYLNPEITYGEVVDERDGQVYKTVAVDTTVWLAENLNYSDSINSPSLQGKSWCYGNDPENCLKYGRIYTFGAAVDSFALANDPDNPVQCGYGYVCKELKPIRGLCMEGWHIPSTAEFRVLDELALSIAPLVYMPDEGSPEVTANAIRSAYIWPYGADTFGFSLLPGGYYKLDSRQFKDIEQVAFLWSIDYNEEYVYMYVIYDDVGTSSIGTTHVTLEEKYMYALNMRCVKD